METNDEMPLYIVDSCFNKIVCQTSDACNPPDYRTVCNKPIVDRNLLTPIDYLNMLSTPKGFKWTGMTRYHTISNDNLRVLKKCKYNRYNVKKYNEQKNENYLIRPVVTNLQKKVLQIMEIKKQENQNLIRPTSENKLSRITEKILPVTKVLHIKKKIDHNKKIVDKKSIENITPDSNQTSDDIKNENNIIFLKKISIDKSIINETENQIEEKETKVEEKEMLTVPLKEKRKPQGELKKKDGKELLKKMKNRKEKQITEKEIIEGHLKSKKKYEDNLKLQALKQEAKRIAIEEEAWRNKINEEFAEQNMLCFTINLNELSITPNCVNNEDDNSMSETDKKRFIQYTNNLLNDLIKNNQVFDPGNLMQQLIKKHLYIAKNRQVKPKTRLESYNKSLDKCQDIQTIEIVDKKSETSYLSKSVVFKKQDSININHRSSIKSYEDCFISNKQKKLPKCIKPDMHCYSHTSFNSVVCHWKNEVADMIKNMQNRRYNFVQNAKAHNMWEY